MSKKNKYFKQDSEGALKECSLRDIIADELKQSDEFYSKFDVDVDAYKDDSGSWIEIMKEEGDKKMAVVLMFNYKGDTIENLGVYETPIKKVVQSEKTKQII